MDLRDLWSKEILIPPHTLTNFEIKKNYQNEPRFNGVYSRDNLPNKINDVVYIIYLDEYSDTWTHWTTLHGFNNILTYFDSFSVEHILKKVERWINGSSITANISRKEAYDSVICGYFCIGFIDFMAKGKSCKYGLSN